MDLKSFIEQYNKEKNEGIVSFHIGLVIVPSL
jgi:hypothetical protein